MIYQYKWASGSHHKVSPQVAGEECEKLERKGELTPANLVDMSRPEDAPLHDEFEWDDTVAAEGYRRYQASSIIRHVVVVKRDEERVENDIRRYVSVQYRDEEEEKTKNKYVCVFKALSELDTREMVLNRAMNELAAFRRKYSNLRELAGVFAAIDKLGERGDGDSAKLLGEADA